MKSKKRQYPELAEPEDYFKGVGNCELPTPTDILLFHRSTKEKLQQEALQNRSHHRFVLIFNIETEGNIQVDNHVYPLSPGQMMLVHPYQFHHFIQMSSSSLYWFFCTFELAEGRLLEPLRNQVVDAGENSARAFDLLLEEWECCSVQSSLCTDDQAGQLQSTLLCLLLSLKQDGQTASSVHPLETGNNLLRTINRLMSEWRGRTVTVSDLAEELDLSESRLRIQFKSATGITMGSYLRNYRLNRAMALLSTSKISIAEIAEEAGFGSPQAFCRIFKKEIGRTPRRYRLQR